MGLSTVPERYRSPTASNVVLAFRPMTAAVEARQMIGELGKLWGAGLRLRYLRAPLERLVRGMNGQS